MVYTTEAMQLYYVLFGILVFLQSNWWDGPLTSVFDGEFYLYLLGVCAISMQKTMYTVYLYTLYLYLLGVCVQTTYTVYLIGLCNKLQERPFNFPALQNGVIGGKR